MVAFAMLLALLSACSDYNLEEKGEPPGRRPRDSDEPDDTDPDPVTDDSGDTDEAEDTDDSAAEPPAEECNGVDDDGDGLVDEDFDANGNGIVDCFEEEAYCTPFDDFSGWNYSGTGDWHVESGLLTEGRAGSYAGIAWLYDLGISGRFLIQVDTAWGASANDLTGIAWAVDGELSYVVRWDDPQGYYGRHSPTGGMDISACDASGCTPLASDDTADLYHPDDMSFATWSVEVDGDYVEVIVKGAVVLSATAPEVIGSGPAVVGLYSNDNDGGVWFDNFCVWVER